MPEITGLKMGKSREKRVNVFLDGAFSFSLLADVAVKNGLKVGLELSDSEIDRLQGSDRYQRCFNAAVRYLGYRPRSESEVRQRLLHHGFDVECTEHTIRSLKERGLVDDVEFARFWIENRETFSPRSRRLAGWELRRKGLSLRPVGWPRRTTPPFVAGSAISSYAAVSATTWSGKRLKGHGKNAGNCRVSFPRHYR